MGSARLAGSGLAVAVALLAPAATPAQTPIPGQLQGEWVREESSFDPNDRMRIRVAGDEATLSYVPPGAHKAFVVGQALWVRIKADGSLTVRGSDGALHAARLELDGPDRIRLRIASGAAGAEQLWRRAGPSIDGEWVRIAEPGHPEDGLRIRADGDRALIRFLPSGAPRSYRVGSLLWRDIAASGSVAVLEGDGGYVPAHITLEGADRLRIAAKGIAQLWVRPEAADAVRVALADPRAAAPTADAPLTAPTGLPAVEIPQATTPTPTAPCVATSLYPLAQDEPWGWELSFPDAYTVTADTLGVLEHRGGTPGRGSIVTDIERSRLPGLNDGVSYVWQRSPQPARIISVVEQDLTGEEYDARSRVLRESGHRAIEIAAWNTARGVRYAGVWISDGTAIGWRVDRGLTGEEYGRIFQERRDEGFRLIDIEVYETADGLRYAGVWHRSCDGENWRQLRDMTRAAYVEHASTLIEEGFREIDIESYRTPHGQRYAVIWEKLPDTISSRIRVDRTLTDFLNDHRQHIDEGFRLVDYEAYATGDGVRYAGIWREHDSRFDLALKKPLNDTIQNYRDRHGIMGLSVVVMHRGEIVYRRGFGWADSARGREASAQTVYLTASISKVIGATVAARLEERGVLHLDSMTSKYLSGLPAHHTHTLAQLLAKTGCVWHYPEGPEPPATFYRWQGEAVRAPVELEVAAPEAAEEAETELETEADPVQAKPEAPIGPVVRTDAVFWDAPLLADCTPGDTYHYSTHGFTFAAAALEGATGKDIGQILDDELIGPLALHSMRPLQARKEGIADPRDYYLAQPYRYDAERKVREPTRYLDSSWKVLGGGIQTNALDLARFGWATQRGHVVSAQTRDERLWTSLTDGVPRWSGGGAAPTVGLAWALGKGPNDASKAGHGGVAPGARAQLDVYRYQNLVVAVLSNQRQSMRTGGTHPVNGLAEKVARVVFDNRP